MGEDSLRAREVKTWMRPESTPARDTAPRMHSSAFTSRLRASGAIGLCSSCSTVHRTASPTLPGRVGSRPSWGRGDPQGQGLCSRKSTRAGVGVGCDWVQLIRGRSNAMRNAPFFLVNKFKFTFKFLKKC